MNTHHKPCSIRALLLPAARYPGLNPPRQGTRGVTPLAWVSLLLSLMLMVLLSPRSGMTAETWSPVAGLEGQDIRWLKASPAGSLLAGTHGGGMFRLADGATSWTVVGSGGLPGSFPGPLAISSASPMVAGVENNDGSGAGLAWSGDDGIHWLPLSSGATTITASQDLSAVVEMLGNPSATRYPSGDLLYARNVWDMQTFDGRLYLGSGNSANLGPAVNAGPSDIWAYNPKSNQFVNEFTADEEQIGTYRILNGELCIPGRDPRVGSVGFYRLESGSWKGYNFSNFYHCYDVIQSPAGMFCALGPADDYPFRISTNNGISWQGLRYHIEEPKYTDFYIWRLFTLFNFKGKSYASGVVYVGSDTLFATTHLLRYDTATSASIVNVDQALGMFPGFEQTFNNVDQYLVRPVNYGDQLVYILGLNPDNNQWDSEGLFAASEIGQGRRIHLKDDARPWDIIIGEDGQCYVLGSIKIANGNFWVTVNASRDLSTWTEILRFHSDTYARSFEQLNGDFYFGLGCDTSLLPASTGNILRVKRSAIEKSPKVTALAAGPSGIFYAGLAYQGLPAGRLGLLANQTTSWTTVQRFGLGTTITALASPVVGTLVAALSAPQAGVSLQYSMDNGDHWTTATVLSGEKRILCLYTAPDGRIYAGSVDQSGLGGLFYSTDQGQHWSSLKATLPSNCGPVCSIVAQDSRRLFIGLGAVAEISSNARLGVFRSGDYGLTWTDFSGKWASPSVPALAANASSFYCVTAEGVLRYVNNTATAAEISSFTAE